MIIIYIAYTSIKDNANDLFALYDLGLNQAVALVGTLIINTGIKISIVYLVIGLADFIYQKHKFNEDMKMTKQEVKDEYKNTEEIRRSKDGSAVNAGGIPEANDAGCSQGGCSHHEPDAFCRSIEI